MTIPNFFARITCCASMPHFDAMAFTTAKISLTNRTVSVNIISVIFFTIIFPNYKSLSMRSCFIRFLVFVYLFPDKYMDATHYFVYINVVELKGIFFRCFHRFYCNRSTKKCSFVLTIIVFHQNGWVLLIPQWVSLKE